MPKSGPNRGTPPREEIEGREERSEVAAVAIGRLLLFATLLASITFAGLAFGLGQVEDGAASSLIMFAVVVVGGLVVGRPR